MSAALHIKGARLIDAATGADSVGDVLVIDGKIASASTPTPSRCS